MKEKKKQIIVPDITGMEIEEAIEELKKKKIEYNEEYIYKISMFKKRGTVLKTIPEKEEKYDGKEKLDIYVSRFMLLPFLLLFILLVAAIIMFVMFSKSEFEYDPDKSPYITLDTDEWAESNVIYLTKNANMENIAYYEYCVRADDDVRKCEWIRTDTNSIEIGETGTWNVWFRAVDEEGKHSPVSNKVTVEVDNEGPEISGEIEVFEDRVVIHVTTNDPECGVTGIYYSLDGENYSELINNEITGLSPNTKYTIYVRAIDCAGNEKIIRWEITTKGPGEDNPNDPENPNNPSNPSNPDNPKDPNNPNNPNDPSNPDNPDDEDREIPEISLRDVPSVFPYGEYYQLPTWYKFGPSGGSVECHDQNNNTLTDTSTLPIGNHTITCSAKGNNGITTTISKEIRVDYQEGQDEEWDGWVILNLYYPEGSTNRMWRLNSDNQVRDGEYGSKWQPYVGPIRVKIDDVSNVYIKYDLDGEEKVEQQGRPVVDIRPESFEVYDFDKTYVEIIYDKEALTKEYRINGGRWKEYDGGFFANANTLIEARVTKQVSLYNSTTGEVMDTTTASNTDSVYIDEKDWEINSLFGKVDINIVPNPMEVNGNEKSTVRIYYQADAENRRYRTNGGEWQDYEGPFEVTRNTVIEAQASARRSVTTRDGNTFSGITTGYAWNKVYDGVDYNSYKVYLSADELIDVTERTDVFVSTGTNLQELWYQIDGGDWVEGPIHSNSRYKLINVGVNTTVSVKARYLDNDNNSRWAWDTIIVQEDKNGLRLYINGPSDIPYATTTPVTISTNYPTNFVKYRINGGEWQDYNGQFIVNNNTYIEAKTEKDNSDGTKQSRYVAKYVGTALLRVNIDGPSYLYQDQHGKAKISANYSSSKLYYSFDGNNWTKYTKTVDVIGGQTIYAKAEYTDPDGILRTDIKSEYIPLVNNLKGPAISASNTATTTTPVTITMASQYAGDIYYTINGGATKKYNGPFEVSSNCHINAYYVRSSDGLKSRSSYYHVSNIRNTNKPTVIINANPNPYTTTGLADSVRVSIKAQDYDLLEYSFDDIYYRPYYGAFNVTNNVTVYARAKNINGYAYDQLVINNVNPIKPTELTSEISLDPAGQNKYNSVNEVTVTLTYDSRAIEKKYRLGSQDSWHDYTGPFNITKNTTIYLYEANDEIRGLGTNSKIVDFLPDGLIDPEIIANPENGTIASSVDVQIEYDSVATVRKYSIDGGALQNYTGNFEVEKNNTVIYAYSEDINGNKATATYTVTNIHDITTAVLDKGMYYLIKLNYPSTSAPEKREYKYGVDGEWKLYPSEGILLIKPEYKDLLVHEDVLIIKIDDGNGNEVEFNGDWYIMDDNISNIIANISMRWDVDDAQTPIIVPSSLDWVSKLNVTIDYLGEKAEELYKIVYKDGRTTGWLNYTGEFSVEENDAVIYAKSMNSEGVWSKEASYRVSNVDGGNPGLRYLNVVETTTGTITVSIDGLANESNIWKYYYSLDNENFIDTGDKQYTYTGLNADTTYTLYVYTQDMDGNKGEVYHIEAKTNQKTQPVISFDPDLETWSKNKTAFINHEDVNMDLYYSFDSGATWIEYLTPILIEQNGTIMAKATDGVNTTQTANYEIRSIDETKPRVTSVIYAPRSSRLIVNATAEDDETEIDHYLYSIDGENYYEGSEEYSLTNLKSNTDYTIYVKAVSKSNLESDPYTVEARTNDIEEITYEIDKPDEWAYTKNVTINYPEEEDGTYIKEYTIDNGQNWKKYTNPVLIEAEDVTIIGRIKDGNQNIKVASSLLVTKIDRTVPTVSLDGLPDEFDVSEAYPLPTSYTVNNEKSGGSVECTSDLGGVHTTAATLPVGGNVISCTATTGAGKSTTVTKNVRVIRGETQERTGESILKILEDDTLESQYYNFKIENGEETINYPVHLFVLDGDQTITSDTRYGDWYDVASGTASTQTAKYMVIVKVNGNYTVNEGITVGPYFNEYGGPKGFMLYVTGKLTNNGTIDNSHGAYAQGENVYLWKNSKTDNFEYVPADGASGGARVVNIKWSSNPGKNGSTVNKRATGGGASGQTYSNYNSQTAGAGGKGTSYSGGTGGGAITGGSMTNAGDGSPIGGAGGTGSWTTGGTGNPGRDGGANGTGGLLIIYSNEYENNGTITAKGTNGVHPGGSSGGGSINIFTNQNTGIDKLGISVNNRYDEIIGSTSIIGGKESVAAGDGTVNIGEIREGQYYDLKDIIQQDIDAYIESHTITGDSILSLVDDEDLTSGYWTFIVNGQEYPVHLYVLDGNQTFTENMTFGDDNDVSVDVAATSTTAAYRAYAQNMVVVKVKGDLTVNEGVTVGPYYTNYGGPKGFMLYVTGKLTNNGTIDNSHGAYAQAQNVYLWKNTDDTFEYVPAVGAAGGARVVNVKWASNPGRNGSTVNKRATGGGASGITYSNWNSQTAGAGGTGSSYSGGAGGGGVTAGSTVAGDGSSIGGPGGAGSGTTGGTGNPGQTNGANGTGGLLIIYSNEYENNGTLTANGTGGNHPGGSSGGGSINIFTNQSTNINSSDVVINTKYNQMKGTTSVSGGKSSVAAGDGTVNIGQIIDGKYYDLKEVIQLDLDYFNEYGMLPERQMLPQTPEEPEPQIQVPSPEITINTTEYTKTKTVSIAYPEGYTNEYSLDLGRTWTNYTSSITINESTTIFARAKDNTGKIVSASTFTIETIDTEVPTIEIEMAEEITEGEEITIPTGYTTTKSGVEYECKIGNDVIENTKNLTAGEYDIICTITNGVGTTNTASKHIRVKEKETNNPTPDPEPDNTPEVDNTPAPENNNEEEGKGTEGNENESGEGTNGNEEGSETNEENNGE